MRLSCPILLKNEGETVFKTLESVSPYIDEFVISVDESTTDNTIDEIRRFDSSIKTFTHKWEGDFSKAQNDLIEKCSHNYILIIDGHEWLGKNRIEEIKKNGKYDVYAADVNMHMTTGDSVMLQPRLFHRKFKYANASHNVLEMNGAEVDPLSLGSIHHKRNESLSQERIEQRKKDNIVDLEKRVKDGDRTALYRIGCEYMAFNNFPEAIIWFEKYLEGEPIEGERYQMMTNLAMCYYHNNDFKNCERILLMSAQQNFEKRNAHMVFLAQLYYGAGDYFRGIYWSTIATTINKPMKFFTIYPSFYHEEPIKIMKKCYQKIGYSKGVKECNAMLERNNGNNG